VDVVQVAASGVVHRSLSSRPESFHMHRSRPMPTRDTPLTRPRRLHTPPQEAAPRHGGPLEGGTDRREPREGLHGAGRHDPRQTLRGEDGSGHLPLERQTRPRRQGDKPPHPPLNRRGVQNQLHSIIKYSMFIGLIRHDNYLILTEVHEESWN